MNDLYVISLDELYLIEGGCKLCKVGSTIAGAATGTGIVLGLASNPAGWVILGGAAIGAGVGYLLAS